MKVEFQKIVPVWISVVLLAACSSIAPLEAQSPAADGLIPVSNTSVQEPAQVHDPVVFQNSTSLPSTDSLQTEPIDVYKQTSPSVVYIISATGSGSGFVYDAKGDIITNSHVAGSRAFEVVFASGGRQSVSLVAAGADANLAVIQVEALPEGVEPLPLAASGDLAVGQFLVAIGNPFGEQGSMSLGIVSGLSRSLPSQRELTSSSSNSLPEVIQTDAPINPANSG